MIDLFREWDEDNNGKVTRAEFHKAMPLLGLDVPAAEMPDPTVDRITVVSKNDCKMVRKLSPPRRAKDAIPPNIQPPPVVPISRIISMAW